MTDDYAGARAAAVAKYRAANPDVPMDEIRVRFDGDRLHVYRSVTIGALYCPKIVPKFRGGFDGRRGRGPR